MTDPIPPAGTAAPSSRARRRRTHRHRQGRATRGTALESRRLDHGRGSTRSRSIAALPGEGACRRPHRPSASTDARVAVRVLPRGRDHHGLGSRHHSGRGPVGPVLRRRASRQLRRVRGTGSHARVRRQRLRRDEPGSIRVGREAPGHELRDRGPVEGPLAEDRSISGHALRALLPGSHGRVRRRDQPRCLVRAPRRRRAHRTLGATGE